MEHLPDAASNGSHGDSHVTHGTGPGYPLTDPTRIPMALDLVLRGTANVAGRARCFWQGRPLERKASISSIGSLPRTCWMTSAGPAPTNMNWPLILSGGVVLRSEARLEGQPFHIIEFIEIAFDETLPADAFTLGVPPGTTFESAVPRWRRDRFPD